MLGPGPGRASALPFSPLHLLLWPSGKYRGGSTQATGQYNGKAARRDLLWARLPGRREDQRWICKGNPTGDPGKNQALHALGAVSHPMLGTRPLLHWAGKKVGKTRRAWTWRKPWVRPEGPLGQECGSLPWRSRLRLRRAALRLFMRQAARMLTRTATPRKQTPPTTPASTG